jgi:hypothetical protein
VRPATRRLLETALGVPIEDLLAPPGDVEPADDMRDLTANFAAARAAGPETVTAFQQRLDLARQLDRRLGGTSLAVELAQQIQQMQEIVRYSVDGRLRRSLAAVIADACALVGWQWLDQSRREKSWNYYAQGRTAAAETDSPSLRSYVLAGQSVVLLDLGDPGAALQMAEHARKSAAGGVPRILAAWLSAAYGESCAANNLRTESLQAFDSADTLLSGAEPTDAPFLVFGPVHLTRWRGNALGRLRDKRAVPVLTDALSALPDGFARAETALRVDLAEAYAAEGEREAAKHHATKADLLARQIGSTRHRRRIERLRRRISISPAAAGSLEDHP